MRRRSFLIVAGLAAAVGLAGCARTGIRFAATTTVEDSGLLAALIEAYRQETGQRLVPLVLASGQALAAAERGDVEVVLTHDPEAEEKFLQAGHGQLRLSVMSNRFLLVGPPDDPAAVRGLSVREALRRVAENESPFVSRGDESGTHAAERALWLAAGRLPPSSRASSWYIESGSGMADTLVLASERGAYTLSDEATFRVRAQSLRLVALAVNDPLAVNRYSVIVRTGLPAGRARAAVAFARWLAEGGGQEVIRRFGTQASGPPLFQSAGGGE